MTPTDPQEYAAARIRQIRPRYRWRPGLDVPGFRRALDKVVGGPLGWRKAPLDPLVVKSDSLEGYKREWVVFGTREGMRGGGWLLTPNKPNGAAVVALPGHGIGADAVAGVRDEAYQSKFGVQCVERGWTTLVLEQVSFGKRRDSRAEKVGGGASSCVRDSMAALMLGETITGWRVFDALRAVDFLAECPGVDPKRIATLGISGGGLTSLFAAALDPRIAACGVSGYFNTFAGSVLAVDHCVDNFVPGLLAVCEMPDMAALVAPRALFVESGDRDPIFPLPTFREAEEVARRIYAHAGASGQFGSDVFAGDHVFHGKALLPFLARALER
jgi:hypothetical protein